MVFVFVIHLWHSAFEAEQEINRETPCLVNSCLFSQIFCRVQYIFSNPFFVLLNIYVEGSCNLNHSFSHGYLSCAILSAMFSSVTSYFISAHTSFGCYVLAHWEIQFPCFFLRRICGLNIYLQTWLRMTWRPPQMLLIDLLKYTLFIPLTEVTK